MTINDDYYNQYRSIYHLIIKSYIDDAMLKRIKAKNKETDKNGEKANNLFVLDHICDLVKQDFALNIYKLLFDNTNKSNNINKYRKFVNSLLSDKNIEMVKKTKYDEVIKELEHPLSNMRNKVIAHNDNEIQNISISISSLQHAIDYITNEFNSLCFNELDERVAKITGKVKLGINLTTFK